MTQLPWPASGLVVIDGQVALKVMLDLTVYLCGPSEQEFEFLFDYYESICVPEGDKKYTIAELEYWPLVTAPDLTQSGRAAAAAGRKRPYFEPVRNRIREGRAFEAAFWDGRPISDPAGSWSFSCKRIHCKSTGLHAFARLLVPLDTDLQILVDAAHTIADKTGFIFGQGGFVFAYAPRLKEGAFDEIYAQARRFWGIDIEDLNDTLPLTKEGIKGINWITLVGREFASRNDIGDNLDGLAAVGGVTIQPKRYGTVLVAGPEPQAGDQHRVEDGLEPYYAVARALAPLFLTEHPDFPGERFIKNGNTMGWIRRFLEPDGWR